MPQQMPAGAGQLRHYVTIETKVTAARDGFGWASGSPFQTLYSDVPAAIVTLSGREKEVARQETAESNTKIIFRYLDGVDHKCRVIWNNRIFNINATDNFNQQNRWLTLTCIEDVQ